MKNTTGIQLLAVIAVLGALALAASGSMQAKEGKSTANKYIGAEKCKSCHGASESGDQYAAWKAMKHFKAFETLASDEAMKAGAERKIAEPQKSEACLECHVTAFGLPEDQIKEGFEPSHGVQCESCHGPGELHMKARFAAAASAEPSTDYVEIPADEIVIAPDESVCVQCHNQESPNYKPFCYHEFGAKVRHLNPKKPRATVDIGKCSCPKCASGCPEECKTTAAK